MKHISALRITSKICRIVNPCHVQNCFISFLHINHHAVHFRNLINYLSHFTCEFFVFVLLPMSFHDYGCSRKQKLYTNCFMQNLFWKFMIFLCYAYSYPLATRWMYINSYKCTFLYIHYFETKSFDVAIVNIYEQIVKSVIMNRVLKPRS